MPRKGSPMAATRPRPDEPSSALTWVVIVITLGIALALVAIFGGPKDVRLKADMGTYSLMNCGPNEGKTSPAEIVANTDSHAASIVNVTVGGGSTKVRVADFAAIDAGRAHGRFEPEAAMSVGAARLPAVSHPREILPGHQALVEVLLTSSVPSAHANGYDITIKDGPYTHVVHGETSAGLTCTGQQPH